MKTVNKQTEKLERGFPCPCGSGEHPTIKYDKDGHFVRYSCIKCKEVTSE